MNLQKNNVCTPVVRCLDSSKRLRTVKQNTLYSREYIHWKIKLDAAVKPPIAVEKHFKLTNNYSAIITRPRGMWFQLSALCVHVFFSRLRKEQIVVGMEQNRAIPLNIFERFWSVSKIPCWAATLTPNFGFLSISFFGSVEKLRRSGQVSASCDTS